MIDVEALRNEKLIEERETYENNFISIEDILKSDELDYYAGPQYEEYLIGEFESELDFHNDNMNCLVYPFEDEDSLIQLRDEKLIEEREAYEADYFASVDFDLIENDIFDLQIEAREFDECLEENNPNLDYGYEDYLYPDPDEYYDYEEEMLYHRSYTKRSQFISSDCGCYDLDYMPHDDGLCDNLDCYDYPDGPDENLCGIKYY